LPKKRHGLDQLARFIDFGQFRLRLEDIINYSKAAGHPQFENKQPFEYQSTTHLLSSFYDNSHFWGLQSTFSAQNRANYIRALDISILAASLSEKMPSIV